MDRDYLMGLIREPIEDQDAGSIEAVTRSYIRKLQEYKTLVPIWNQMMSTPPLHSAEDGKIEEGNNDDERDGNEEGHQTQSIHQTRNDTFFTYEHRLEACVELTDKWGQNTSNIHGLELFFLLFRVRWRQFSFIASFQEDADVEERNKQ